MRGLPPILRKPALSYAALAVALACHIAALSLYGSASAQGRARPGEERLQLLTLLAVSSALAFGMFAAGDRSAYRLLLAARAAALLVLGYRFRFAVELRLVLTASLLTEIGVYDPFPANLALQGAVLALLFVFYDLVGRSGPPIRAALAAEGFLLPGLLGGAVSLVTRYRERLLAEEDHARRLDETVSRLSDSNSRMQEFAFHAQEQSRVSERQRLTREIHDTVGYTLTNLIMMMEAATDLVLREDPRDLESIMQAAREQAASGLEETRRALRALREHGDPPLHGLRAIARLVETFETAGTVRVEVHYGNAPLSCGEAIDSALYHFVQEGLTNALRHGKASRIRISFWVGDGTLSVTISDNGVGSTDMKEGIGFAGMRERLDLVGGRLVAQSTGTGFRVAVAVPLQAG